MSGYTRKKGERYVCIVSMHNQVRTKQEFDVLLNKEQGAKLSWTDWSTGLELGGSISTINGASVSLFTYSTLKEITSMVFIL